MRTVAGFIPLQRCLKKLFRKHMILPKVNESRKTHQTQQVKDNWPKITGQKYKAEKSNSTKLGGAKYRPKLRKSAKYSSDLYD